MTVWWVFRRGVESRCCMLHSSPISIEKRILSKEERRNHGGRAKDVPFGVDRDFDFEFDEAGGDDDKADTGTETYSRVPLVVTLVIIVEEPDDLADFELDLERTDE